MSLLLYWQPRIRRLAVEVLKAVLIAAEDTRTRRLTNYLASTLLISRHEQ